MEINEILKMQVDQDEKVGFPVKFQDKVSLFNHLSQELVGLFGELGEFSNLVKKVNIKHKYPDTYNLDLKVVEDGFKEELADSFIYLLRICAMLDVDLEEEVLKKMEINATRYETLRK